MRVKLTARTLSRALFALRQGLGLLFSMRGTKNSNFPEHSGSLQCPHWLLEQRIRDYNHAFVVEKSIDSESYQEMVARTREELAVAKIERSEKSRNRMSGVINARIDQGPVDVLVIDHIGRPTEASRLAHQPGVRKSSSAASHSIASALIRGRRPVRRENPSPRVARR